MGLLDKLFGRRATANGASDKSSKKSSAKHSKGSEFRAVEIVTQPGCCSAASALTGQRFLSNDVPLLPLKDCTAASCECSYQLMDDRRSDVRRASDVAYDIASDLHKDNKRRTPDRREE